MKTLAELHRQASITVVSALLSPLTNDVVARVVVHPTYWPDCSRCGQSMTGCYAGIARCNRCSSARRLNG